MKKSIYLIGLLMMSLAFVGCDKSKSGNNGQVYAYAPNSCYNNGYNGGYNGGYGYPNNYNQFNNGNYNYNQRYQWNNGQCVDVRDGGAVNSNLCRGNVNYSYNNNCTYYGYNNGVYNGPVSGAYNACSLYNTAVEQFYPIYYPSIGTTVCVGYSTFNTMNSYYSNYRMASYGGYAGVYQGCTMGGGYGYTPYTSTSCKCKSLGGTLGWFSAGVSMGVCYTNRYY